MTETAIQERAPGTGWEQQTFLVGNQVYLRSFIPGDEKNAMSWRSSIFPKSPEAVEKWIKEELPKAGNNNMAYLAIVRKADDVVVGNTTTYVGDVGVSIYPHVDPLYGEKGQQWLAEAVALVARWQVDERFVPRADVHIGAHLASAVNTLLQQDFVQVARWREMIELNGERVDQLLLAYLSDAWVERIGHPLDADVPRSGNGQARPVPAKSTTVADPPKQAVIIGKRVYLRPQDKSDAKNYVQGDRLETEPAYNIGRHLRQQKGWESLISSQANDDFPTNLWFEACLLENDESIGAVGLLDVNYVNRTAETGSHFYKVDSRGKGFGSEAKHLLLEYSFDVLGLHVVNSFCYFANTRSAAALRKQGYTEAGRVVWAYPYEGGLGNMLTFDLLAEEWRNLPREN